MILALGNARRWFELGSAAGLCLLFAGCTPPGPRALLQGERLLSQGKAAQAVERMETAVQLLPDQARAFNHLGLAYHAAGRPGDAAQAYRKALALDRNLGVARFNLGCLLLEQNQPGPAAAELTTFTGLQVNSGPGWLRLGHAQVRLGQSEAAERSFRRALELGMPAGPTLNGIGLALVQRRQHAAAWREFTGAHRQQPNYAPAILNAAIVAQHYLRERDLAIQAYRKYLALSNPPNADAVRRTLAMLEAPVPAPPRVEPSPTPAPSRTTPVVARQPQTNLAPSPAPVRQLPPDRSSRVPDATAGAGRSDPATPTNRPSPPPATVKTETPTPRSTPAVSPSISEEVAKTGTSSVGAKTEASPGPRASNEVLVASRQLPAVPRADPNRLESTNRASRATNATPSAPAATQPSATPPSVPSNRFGYPYANFDVPPQGNRAEAVRLLTEGINAQRAYRIRDALERYRSAAVADPSLFEAHYNRGVAAFEAGELGESLRAYERALSINETSVPARFNFATALEKSGYPEAAVHELELLVTAHPEEVRAHLALGNLQARRFGDRARAREHYRKVLELNPQHPEAGTLRFWIEANP